MTVLLQGRPEGSQRRPSSNPTRQQPGAPWRGIAAPPGAPRRGVKGTWSLAGVNSERAEGTLPGSETTKHRRAGAGPQPQLQPLHGPA